MIRLLVKDKRYIGDVISYGVYLTAMSQKLSMENAALQLLYAYRNGANSNQHVELPSWLTSNLEKLDEQVGLLDYDDHGNFTIDGASFAPYTEMGDESRNIVLDYCASHKYFAENVVEFHALRQVAELFDFSWINIDGMQRVHEKYKKFDNEKTYAFANIQIMFDYRNDIYNKSDDDIACLVMYLAYKSILQNQDVCRTNKEMVLARMVGESSPKNIDDVLKECDQRIQDFYNKYKQREVFERIRSLVLKYKFIGRIYTIPGHPRSGTFVSCKKDMTDKEFSKIVLSMLNEGRKQRSRETTARYRERNRLKNDTSNAEVNAYLQSFLGQREPSKGK